MYYPDYIALIVFMLGAFMAAVVYIKRLIKIRKQLGVKSLEMYDEKYSDVIKQGMKGVTRLQILWIIIFLILAIITAIINKQ